LLQGERYVLRSGSAIDGKPSAFAPGNKGVDVNVNLFHSLALTLKRSESVKGASFPLFKRLVQFISVFYDFREPLPLASIEPRETYNHAAIRARF